MIFADHTGDPEQGAAETKLLIMPWDGIRFDSDTGQNTLAKGVIVQIQDRAYYTVWPWDLAARELVWPMLEWTSED